MFFLLQPFCCDPALNILHHGCWRQNCPNHPGLCSLPIPDLGSLGRGSGERRGGKPHFGVFLCRNTVESSDIFHQAGSSEAGAVPVSHNSCKCQEVAEHGAASDPLEFSNFQVFKLATSLNVPSVLAAGEIRVEDGVYRVVCDVFEAGLVGTFKNSEDWSLEMTSLGWLRGCQLFQ